VLNIRDRLVRISHKIIIYNCRNIEEVFFAGEPFNASHNKTSWGQDCQLASPNLKYSDNERVLQMNEDDLSGLNVPEEGLWIGFAKAFAAFTYIGESRHIVCWKMNYQV